jgi:transcriptional regulator with XRE-family HTH domain
LTKWQNKLIKGIGMDTDIGKLIKEGRRKKGLTQHKLAEMLKVDTSSISRWESNEKVPSGDTLIKLAILLNIVPDLFPDYDKIKQQPSESSLVGKEELEKVWEDNKKLWQVIRFLEASLQQLEKKVGEEITQNAR